MHVLDACVKTSNPSLDSFLTEMCVSHTSSMSSRLLDSSLSNADPILIFLSQVRAFGLKRGRETFQADGRVYAKGIKTESVLEGLPRWLPLVVKNPSANTGVVRDAGSIPGLGRSSGEGHGNPL